MVILIGREASQSRLLVAVQGTGKAMAIGAAGSVPQSVSRCRVAEGKAHAKITVDGSCIVITNETPQNVTYVNGHQIMSKHVALTDMVQLGMDRFAVNLQTVIDAANKIPEPPVPAPAYDISHLESVWNEFQRKKDIIQARQRRINLIRVGCGMFTMCAMPCVVFFGKIGYVLTGIGLIGNLYSFIGLKNDNTSQEVEKIIDEFQDRYVCPNPKCNKFLGQMKYRLLRKQYSQCPYCKCRFEQK